MKYYYTCPLESAYMAKHHGMSFSEGSEPFNVHIYSHGLNTPRIYSVNPIDEQNIYIHPESLHLLEPQVGDLINNKHLLKTYTVIDETPRYGHEVHISFAKETMAAQYSIIQRNGKAFFWPEVEQ